MLGRLRMDVDDCIRAYSEFCNEAFAERARASPEFRRFNEATLKLITSRGFSPDELFNDGHELGCKTSVHTWNPLLTLLSRLRFICAASNNRPPILKIIRAYNSEDNSENNSLPVTIHEAAMATLAAGDLFKDYESYGFVHEWFANFPLDQQNPIQCVIKEAAGIQSPSGNSLEERLRCVVSIGASKPTNEPNQREGSISSALFSTADGLWMEIEQLENYEQQSRSFRFNTERALLDDRPLEQPRRRIIQKATEKHMNTLDFVQNCVQKLLYKQTLSVRRGLWDRLDRRRQSIQRG